MANRRQDPPKRQTAPESCAEARAIVARERARGAARQVIRAHTHRQRGQPETGIQPAGCERRDRARRVADEQPAIARDAAKHAIHRNAAAPPLHPIAEPPARRAQPLMQRPERARRVEALRVAADADMHRLSVIDQPAEVARRDPRIDEAVECRRLLAGPGENIFDAHDPLVVPVEPERARDTRHGSIRADHEPRAHAPPPFPALQPDRRAAVHRRRAPEARGRGPFHTRGLAVAQHAHVKRSHVSDPELVHRALERQPASRRRMQHHPPHGWPETFLRQREILERPPHEDPGRPNAAVEPGAPVDQQDGESAAREAACRAESGKPGPHDDDIEIEHGRPPSRIAKNSVI